MEFSSELALASHVRVGLLRGGNDAHGRPALRHGPVRHHLPRVASSGGLHHRRRHGDQQDGARAAQSVRPDAHSQVGPVDGQLRERRRLLPLLVLRVAWRRPRHPRRHLRARFVHLT